MPREQGSEDASLEIIDFDREPEIPLGWSIHEEDQPDPQLCCQGRGGWKFEQSYVCRLDLADVHKREIFVEKTSTTSWPFLFIGVQILEYYYANQHLIPSDWNDLTLFSFGNIYRDNYKNKYARCLFKNGNRWYFGQKNLNSERGDKDRILVFEAP